jgi:hypothetical protein
VWPAGQGDELRQGCVDELCRRIKLQGRSLRKFVSAPPNGTELAASLCLIGIKEEDLLRYRGNSLFASCTGDLL